MRKLGLLAACFLVAFASPAAAQGWRSLGWAGEAPERYFYFVDVDSISRNGDLVSFSELEILEALEPNGANRVLNHREGNCRTSSTVILRTSHSRDGRVVYSTDQRDEWVVHPQGSMMGDGLRMICGAMAYDSGPIADPEAHARRYFREN